jgi:alkylhydroperoxidase family enzyme
MAHVELVQRPQGLIRKYAFRYSRRRFGRTVEPTQAAANHGAVLMAWGAMEMGAARGWKKLDKSIRGLVVQLVSTRIGCTWCIDYGYYENLHLGVDPAKVRSVPSWRDSPLFDERERVALEFAETATGSPAEVSAELAQRLHRHFDDEQIVELAAWVALENFRSRFNAGLGLKSQGFSDSCDVPLDPSRRGTAKSQVRAAG